MFNVWHWPGYRTGILELVIVPLLLYSMVRLFATDQRTQTLTAVALLAGGILVATVGLAGWAAGGGTNADAVRRLVGPYFSPNHAALYLERSFLLGMGFLHYLKCREETETGSRSKAIERLSIDFDYWHWHRAIADGQPGCATSGPAIWTDTFHLAGLLIADGAVSKRRQCKQWRRNRISYRKAVVGGDCSCRAAPLCTDCRRLLATTQQHGNDSRAFGRVERLVGRYGNHRRRWV